MVSQQQPSGASTSEQDKELKQKTDAELKSAAHEQHEEEHEEEEEEQTIPDFSGYSKKDLFKELEKLSVGTNLHRDNTILNDIRHHYDEIMEAETAEAFDKFIEDGGEERDFDYRKDELSEDFERLYGKLKADVQSRLDNLDEEKKNNLRKRKELLEALREVVDNEEKEGSNAEVRRIRDEWKSIGPMPPGTSRDLWANYNALMERYYNNRSIYFELKELDRKKNLATKEQIVKRAEQLSEEDDIVEAIKELKKLHIDYKHIGPVPRDQQEELWNRLKAASDKVYERRGEYQEKLKKEFEENLSKKEELIKQVAGYADFTTEKIDEWKSKTKEMLDLQNSWKNIGSVPRDKSKEVSRMFWSGYKQFFRNKDKFFKELEGKKKENLKVKEELCEKAEALKDDDNFKETAEALKKLQKDWQKVGPVPIKQKDPVFKRFKAACDHFFERKRAQVAEAEKDYEDNLRKKMEVIGSIEELAKSGNASRDKIIELQKEYEAIGFVPKKNIQEVREKYKEAVETLLQSLDGQVDEKDRERMKLELKVSAIKATPSSRKKLNRKQDDLYKKMQNIKSEIDSLMTNVEFLANSPKAAKLREQVESQIEEKKEKLKLIKDKMDIIRESK